MTKIDIFSGFLGAGKTTLIKKLIAESFKGEKLVLIENEFGEIGIDGGFMQEAGIEVTEMNSGCICCSLVGDFAEALKMVVKEYSPERILIEPSGVGKLSDVIRAVQGVDCEGLKLNSFTAVCDAGKAAMYMKNFGEFYNDQIEHAATVVMSHADKVSDEKLAAAVALIREHNQNCTIVSTPLGELTGDQILAAMEHTDTLEDELKKLAAEAEEDEVCPVCGHHHHHHHDDDEDEHEHHHHHHHHDDDDDDDDDEHEHHHHHHDDDDDDEDEHEHHHHHHGHYHHHDADEIFESWGKETGKAYDKETLAAALSKLSDEATYGVVLRAKGIVKSTDGSWIHFDYVPGESDIRIGGAIPMGRLCVIGSKLCEEEIEKLF